MSESEFASRGHESQNVESNAEHPTSYRIAIVEDNREFGEAIKETLESSTDLKGSSFDVIDPAKEFPQTETVSAEEAIGTRVGQRISKMDKFVDAETDENVEFKRSMVIDKLAAKLSRRHVPAELIGRLSTYDLVMLDNMLDYGDGHYRGSDIAKLLPKSVNVMSISGDKVHYGSDSFTLKSILDKNTPNAIDARQSLINRVKNILDNKSSDAH